MASSLLPRAQASIVGPQGIPTREFYNFLLSLAEGTEDSALQAQILALAARVAALEAEEQSGASIQGPLSVSVTGSLSGGVVQISLEGDVYEPGLTFYYGTNALGEKGWHAVADTLAQGDGITLTVNPDGTTEIAHADTSSVTDISAEFTGGTVPWQLEMTFDQFGHVLTRTITGRTLDHNDTGTLQGGNATERYHFTESEHAGLLPWSGEAPADFEPTIAPGTTGQFWRGDKTFSDTYMGLFGIGQAPDRPFLLNTTGSPLGAGTASFMVTGDSNKERMEMRSSGGDPTFQAKRSGGTQALPSATSNGELLAQFAGSGHDGTDWVVGNRALIRFRASQTWTPTAQGATISFLTNPNGSAAIGVERWTIAGNGTFFPSVDNSVDVGSSTNRVKEYWGVSGAINTSDVREKTIRGPLTPAELAAAQELAAAGVIYQWNHAIAEKGDAARWHFGPTVQDVIAIMESHGLDPFRYGFVCYDEWEELPELRGEDGEVLQEFRAAGDRYSLRHNQLLLFIARGQEERLARLEALIPAPAA